MSIQDPVWISLGPKERDHRLTYVAMSRVTNFKILCIGPGVELQRLTSVISSGKKLQERLLEDHRLMDLHMNTKLTFGFFMTKLLDIRHPAAGPTGYFPDDVMHFLNAAPVPVNNFFDLQTYGWF